MRRYGAFFVLLSVFMGLAFVPYASADWPTVWEWETQTKYSHVRSITWSGDGEYLAAISFDDDENGVRHSVAEMWDTMLENHRVFGTDDLQPISAALNEDGSRLFTSLSTGDIALWDTVSGEVIQRTVAHKTASELILSDDWKWLVSWNEDSVIIWHANTLERHSLITKPAQTRDSVNFVFATLNQDSETLAVGNSAGVVLLYDLKSKTHISSFVTGEHGKPYGAFYDYDGQLVLGYKSSIVKLCNLESKACEDFNINVGMYQVVLGYTPSDTFLIATNDGNIEGRTIAWDGVYYMLKTDLYNVSDIAVSPFYHSYEAFIAIGAYPGRLIVGYSPLCACSLQLESDLL